MNQFMRPLFLTQNSTVESTANLFQVPKGDKDSFCLDQLVHAPRDRANDRIYRPFSFSLPQRLLLPGDREELTPRTISGRNLNQK